MNDDVFDEKIKKKLKNEIESVPNDINELFDSTSLKIKRHRFNYKKICSICIIFLCGTIGFSITMPTYASNVPILGNIIDVFTPQVYENYDKYASDLNITKESNGLKMTVTKIVYDEMELAIFYTVESDKELTSMPMFPGAILKINGESTSFGAGGHGEFFDDNKTYVGVIEYDIGMDKLVPQTFFDKLISGKKKEIPDNFKLSLSIDEILSGNNENIKGNWEFNIPVSNEKVAGKINEKDINIDLSEISEGASINKIIMTPINTIIQGVSSNLDYDQLFFYAFDDKGRYLLIKGAQGSSKDKTMYSSANFKEIYEDTESITFVPYRSINTKIYSEGEMPDESDYKKEEIVTKLNLQGETKLESSNGQEYLTITRVEAYNGNTKIYYKSKYGLKALPIEIWSNTTNEKVLDIDINDEYKEQLIQENISYLKDSDEYVLNFDGALNEGDYSIKVIDKSNSIEVYKDSAFTIDVK